ncbi:MAG: hypothetical protein ACRDMV_25225 [Streptosporangiales bacterium]
MSVVTITINGLDAKVRSPFSAKDLVKSMPIREWSPAERVWIIPAFEVDDLVAILEADGYRVVVTRRNGEQQQKQQHQPPPGRNGSGKTWADDMFLTLGPDLGEKAFKALVRAIHPDLGGSTTAMQQLNAARDRHGQRT